MRYTQKIYLALVGSFTALMLAGTAAPGFAQGGALGKVVLPADRTVLPIPELQYPHSMVLDARNATPPP